MTIPTARFHDELLAIIPSMRAYARTLCRDKERADDLVQETLLKAWEKHSALRETGKLKSWVLQIMRNLHLMNRRQQLNKDVDDTYDIETIACKASQDHAQEISDVCAALSSLSAHERDAIVLVAIQELSCDEAASVCGCSVGTFKSRLNRAREHLRNMVDPPRQTVRADFGSVPKLAARDDHSRSGSPRRSIVRPPRKRVPAA